MLNSPATRITSRVSRARILTVLACSALGLCIMASGASALTQQQKADAFWGCKNAGGSNRDCCHLIGGKYEADYDEQGNLVAEHCWVTLVGQGPAIFNGNPVGANPGTGASTSSAASGGMSKAGVYRLVDIGPGSAPPPAPTTA